MKKIFILPILIAPIVAHATDPIGPSAVGQGETAVVATAPAPYAIAREEIGDTTNVVSASYVKGAYNDAIAAVNKVNADKQEKVFNTSGEVMTNYALGGEAGQDITNRVLRGDMTTFEDFAADGMNPYFVAGDGLASAALQIKSYVDYNKRVSAVTTWGDDSHPTNLQLTTASN